MTDEEKVKVNKEFLEAVRKSFQEFLNSGSRSNAKLKPLHGKIADLILEELEKQTHKRGYFEINSLREPPTKRISKEETITGKYYEKKVDIRIKETGDQGRILAGYAVKFVMQNYLQNSNNYFENMLGETANIRYGSIPYFQIFIIFSEVPYYDKDGNIIKYEEILKETEDKKEILKETEDKKKRPIDKYIELSKDNTGMCFHTPDLISIAVIDISNPKKLEEKNITREMYIENYCDKVQKGNKEKWILKRKLQLVYSNFEGDFGDIVEYNNMAEFIERSVAIIRGKYKFK